ncbi:NADH-quinone oxidoreductase subunit N [Rhabdothermincola sp.]|uniref:NADH-quinone oxidoreductase subunit N n=1 Tax=Rhabdothermincola sp. TaxID=2820405 RepID=UPI002FE03C04
MLAQFDALTTWTSPSIDFHAFAPEIIVVATISLLILLDLFGGERNKWTQPSVAGIGLLVAGIPIVTLAYDGVDRVLFGGGYVVDDFALVLKALFVISGYVVVLISTNYIAEGDYWEGEYYQLILSSVLGMMVMASARDLVSIFVALELLSIPAYMLAAWRKRDLKSNEAGLKYYLMGVFASAILLYGMSLLYGLTGSTLLRDIGEHVRNLPEGRPLVALAIVFVIVGFAFKVSAVPFHTWAPDTYEGAPTPVTAFLAVASKAAGFVAIVTLVFVGFYDSAGADVYEPVFFVLSLVTMTVGNLIALRQTNVVRLMAYSGIAQAGYIMAPLAIAGVSLQAGETALQAIVMYLLIYAAMNLGAFAVIIAVARKTRSAELESYGGLFQYAPGLAVAMTIFLFSLAGIPPLAGWFGKFVIFRALVEPGTTPGYVLAVAVGLNSVIALFYYARIARQMWMEDAPLGDRSPIRVPVSLNAALAITVVVTIVLGVAPYLVTRLTENVTLLGIGT